MPGAAAVRDVPLVLPRLVLPARRRCAACCAAESRLGAAGGRATSFPGRKKCRGLVLA